MNAPTHSFPLIEAKTLRAWLNDGNELALLDVREAGQFGEGHPFFAIPLPYSRLELDIARLVPRQSVRIVLIDDGDAHPAHPAQATALPVAVRAARRLRASGYHDVSILQGGVRGWVAAGYTLFKGVNVPSKTFGELVEHAYDTPRVSAAELSHWLERSEQRREPLALLDGRTREEHRKMSIPGSTCCPNGELAYRVDAFVDSPRTPIVVHCAGRTRSIIGAQTLRSLGIANPVYALENGTQGWALAGLGLEHGSTRSYADLPLSASPATSIDASVRERAQALAARFGIAALDAQQAHRWLADTTRTTYALDIRTHEEFAENGLPGATHAPGGQLIQATDQTIAVRHARLLLIDYDGVRAPVVGHWLHQLGYEVATIDAASAATLTDTLSSRATAQQQSADPDATPEIDPSTLRDLAASKGEGEHNASVLLDLRSSAEHLRQHPVGSHWTIRPRVFDTLASVDAQKDATIILVTDANSRDSASLVAIDLHEAGYPHVVQLTHAVDSWKQAGLALDTSGTRPAATDRIDYLFFVHDRHDGNLDAARAYLAWETGLVAQCQPDELAGFRIGVPHSANVG